MYINTMPAMTDQYIPCIDVKIKIKPSSESIEYKINAIKFICK